MRRGWGWAVAGVAVSLAAAATTSPDGGNLGERRLLERAAYWEENARADLARQALEKYLLANPEDGRVWHRLGMLGIRMGEPGLCTAVVRRMREVLPDDPYTRALAGQCRVATEDRLAMAAVRRLAEEERYAEAADAFEALFDGDIPGGALGLEYLQLREQAEAPWSALHEDFRRLARDFPENPAIQLGYAGHLAQRRSTARAAIRRLQALDGRTETQYLVLRYWRTALRNLSDAPDIRSLVARYLETAPEDAEFRRMAARLERSDLREQAAVLLNGEAFARAEALLSSAVARHPDDPWLRYDLARARIGLGRREGAAQVMAEGVSRQPDLAAMRYAAALILTALDRSDAARAELEAVPPAGRSPAMIGLLDRLRFGACLRSEGAQLLACVERAGDDPDRWRQLVDAWFSKDLAEPGLARMAAWRDENRTSAALDRVWIDALARAARYADALAAIRQLQTREEGRGDTDLMAQRVALALRLSARDGEHQRLRALVDTLEASTAFDRAARRLWLARLQQGLGEGAAARAHYAALLACCADAMPVNARLEYARLLADDGQHDAAEMQLRQAFRVAGSGAERAEVAMTSADIGGAAAARPLLAAALDDVPDNAWLRHRLARTLIALGQEAEADALMREGVAAYPEQSDMRFAAGLIFESLGQSERALQQVEAVDAAVRSPGMLALAQRMRFEGCLDRAAQGAALADCEAEAGDDPGRWRRLTLARFRDGEERPALVRFRQWMAGQPQEPDVALAAVQVFVAAGEDDAVRELLASWRGAPALDAGQRLAFLRAEADWQLARDAHARELEPLIERLAKQAEAADDPRPALRQIAEIRTALGQHEQAVARYAEVVERQSVQLADRLAYAAALYNAESPEAARAQLDAGWAEACSLDERLAVARIWMPSREAPSENPFLARLREERPDDYRVTVAAADQALRMDRPAAAVELLETAEGQAPADRRAEIAARAEAVRDRRRALLAGGYDLATVPGVPGISDRKLATGMLEWRHPVHWDDQLVLKLDATRMDVGRLTQADAVDFGQFGTLAPGAREAFFPQRQARETGLGVGLAYEGERWRLDLGSTPLGFPKPFLVGGLRYSGTLGDHQWQAGVSRRAVTSTFLSYAGDRDPVSNRFWGAPHSDGIQISLARYEARFDYAASLYVHRIIGEHIPDNQGLIAQARTSRELYRRPGLSLSAGLNSSYWAYDRNQRFYTFGHGGYYSPQSYLTLSLPLYAHGGFARWSYSLQAGVAYTYSREDEADYYPGRADLQAAARAAGETPVYAGGSGGGPSVQLDAAAEYALSEHLAIGARFAINRADFYEPNFFTLYLRHSLGSGTPHLQVPPRRISPYRDW